VGVGALDGFGVGLFFASAELFCPVKATTENKINSTVINNFFITRLDYLYFCSLSTAFLQIE
jgi:hypothetical protein